MSFPTIQPGCWYEVPNSKISSVLPNPLPPGSSGPNSVVEAWSGGCYDSTRDEYVVGPGGGHGDYAGNEQYRLPLSGNLQWYRSWGPTPNAQIPPGPAPGAPTYLNGDPAARHSYSGIIYMPDIDRMMVCGGSLWSGSGGMGRDVWLWTPTSFERKKDVAFVKPDGSTYSAPTPPYCAYDPVTGHVFQHRLIMLGEWDHVADVWTQRGSWDAGGTPSAGAVIDPIARKFWMIGGGQISYYKLSGTGVTNKRTPVTTQGPQNVVNPPEGYPGVEWDSVSERIVGWAGGTTVYSLNPATLVWTAIPASPANTVNPGNPTKHGSNGRWRYVSNHDCYIIVNSISSNVFLYRPDRGTSGVILQVAASVRVTVQ